MSQDEVSRIIARRVRAARAAAGLSRKRLAETADVSERYLNQLENGDANASVGILSRVARALGVEIVDLLQDTSSPSAGGVTAVTGSGGLQPPLAGIVYRMSAREQEAAAPVLQRFLDERRKSLRGIALLGLRGAGKSTIGEMYAERHQLPFISITREIEARAGLSLNDLFNLGGPDAYRSLENEVVRDLSSRSDRIVVETAGGIVSNGPALEIILGAFRSVWLKASPEEHLQRVVRQGDMRPMQSTPKALEHLSALLAQREPEYARADHALDTTGRTPADCVGELERIAGV
jgi:XRE family aerobic/anaerobic benzoate catabolism transcriptional regulator